MGSISHHIIPLVINSLRGGGIHTHKHTHAHTHTYRHPHRSNFKKPDACQPAPGLKRIPTYDRAVI